MERNDRSSAPSTPPTTGRDTRALSGPDPTDEAAADEARRRFRAGGFVPLAPDAAIRPLLVPGECVIGVHRRARFDRRQPEPGVPLEPRLVGDVYVTSRRLVLIGRQTLPFELAAVEDGVVSGRRLLLILRDGRGLTLEVDRPRLLWVEIATARGRTGTRRGSAREGLGRQPAER